MPHGKQGVKILLELKMDLTWVKTIEILMVVKLLLHQLHKL
jgi:hypothetical protein